MRYRAITGATVGVAAAVAVTPALAAAGPKAGLYVDAPKQVYVQIAADGKTVTLLGGSCLTKKGARYEISRNGQWPARVKLRSDKGFHFAGTTPLGKVDVSARFANGRFTGTLKVTGCATAPFNAPFYSAGGG